MSVTTSNYTTGGNSKLIAAQNETSSTNLILAVDSAITGLGWSTYDTVGTTTFSPVTTKVYRVLNADGVTYKYLILRWDTIKQVFYTSTCESWSTTTDSATNESWNAGGGFAQGYDIVNGFIIVSATARHIMLWPFVNNQAGLWTAVVEFERVADADIASITGSPYPCHAWTSSVMIGTPWGVANNGAAPSQTMFAFPRLPNGVTGQQAAYYMTPMTNKGFMPQYSFNGSTVTIAGDGNYAHLGTYFKNLTYKWDLTGLKSAFSAFSVDTPGYNNYIMPFGRAYNFGVIARTIGQNGDTIYANVDTAGGWPSSNTTTSTNTECFLLPLNGGTQITADSYTPQYGGGLYNTVPVTVSTNVSIAAATTKSFTIGDTLWLATGEGIKTASLSGGAGQIAFTRVPNASGITDMVYDGQRTIYGAAGNGIVKIDTVTYTSSYATSAQTLANGCGYLGIDNKFVYAGQRIATVSPTIVVLDQNLFQIATANTFVHRGAALGTASVYGTPVPDYQGNIYAFTQPGASTATTTFLSSYNATGFYGTTSNNPMQSGSVVQYGGSAIWYDVSSNGLWAVMNFNGSINSTQFWSNSLTASSTILSTGYSISPTTTNFSNNLKPGVVDYLGDMTIMPFRGMFYTAPKRPGIAAGGPNPYQMIVFNHPNTTTANTVVQVSNPNSVQVAATGLPSHPFQSGSTLTTNGGQLFGGYCDGTTNRAYIINGVYLNSSSAAYATNRLVLKG